MTIFVLMKYSQTPHTLADRICPKKCRVSEYLALKIYLTHSDMKHSSGKARIHGYSLSPLLGRKNVVKLKIRSRLRVFVLLVGALIRLQL